MRYKMSYDLEIFSAICVWTDFYWHLAMSLKISRVRNFNVLSNLPMFEQNKTEPKCDLRLNKCVVL